MTIWRWTALLVLVMWTATCGQKGPLQLPEPKTGLAGIQVDSWIQLQLHPTAK